MPLPRKPSRARITATMQALIRSFPAEHVRLVRTTPTWTAGKTRGPDDEAVVYEGEALFPPAGGDIRVLGVGRYLDDKPRMIVPGNRDVKQGDRLTYRERLFEVSDLDNRWNAFVICKLNQVQG